MPQKPKIRERETTVMHRSTIALRFNAVAVILFFFMSTCWLIPSEAEARKAHGKTRTSVHRGGGGNKNMKVNRTPNRNVNRGKDSNRNVNRNKNINVNKNVNVNVNKNYHGHGGYRYYDDDHHDVGVFVAGAVTGLVIGSIVKAASMPPSCSTTIVNGISYQQCGSTWYQPQYSGSQVNYIVVNPPQ